VQITSAHDANQRVALDNWQVPNLVLAHESLRI
jgi:hypothetical protein